MTQNPSWKTLSSKYVYENNWIKVREDEIETPHGKKGTFGVVEGRPFVMIIPKIKDEFHLIETYRYTVNKLSIEFPAGGIETNESIDEAASRELQEEAGLKSNNLKRLGFLYSSNGFSNVAFHVYLAENCELVDRKLEDFEEGMSMKKPNIEELKKLIKSGHITDSPTIAAFSLYELNK